jgi:hypothetical protein
MLRSMSAHTNDLETRPPEDALESVRIKGAPEVSVRAARETDDHRSNGLERLIGNIPADRLRFLTSDRRRVYASILWLLLNHRRSHEIEVYYDDLLVEVLGIISRVDLGSYTPEDFRSDVRQLVEWGNLSPLRLEPRRIETLADRSLQKFLCRLDDETAAVLEFLEGRTRATAVALSDRGRHLLRDAAERLVEAVRLAEKLGRESAGPSPETAEHPPQLGDELLRLSYLCFEVDRKVDEAARELATFDAALVRFAVSPFQLEMLAEVVDRLERYVEDYVAEVAERARTLHRAANRLLHSSLNDVLLRSREQVDRRRREDPLLAGAPESIRDARELLVELVPFFAPGGRFETLLERVHGAARDVVRRVHKHVENVRARNIRIETLRDRSREMARLPVGDIEAANAWLNGLFASAHHVTDLRCGTPDERAPLPRPARRYESRRAAHRGEYLWEKRGTPGQSRALEVLRLLGLGHFVDGKILCGARRASLADATLDGLEDFRTLLDSVKAHDLRAGRLRSSLSYRIARPAVDGEPPPRARFTTTSGSLDAPALVFTQAGRADRHG